MLLQKFTEKHQQLAKQVEKCLLKYSHEGVVFKHIFIANTNQSKGWLVFFEPYLKHSHINNGALDKIVTGYDLRLLNNVEVLAKKVAVDYFKSGAYSVNEKTVKQLIDDEEKEIISERLRIGDMIRSLRKEKKISTSQLARLIGTERPRISEIENGHYSVGIDMLNKIAAALGCQVDFIKK
jgi:DNA-binding XRE family transcriptional regulator